MCENPKPEISSGNCPLYFFVSELDVGFRYLKMRIDSSFVKCCPKNDDRQIVFTQPRPQAALNNVEFCVNWMAAFEERADPRSGQLFRAGNGHKQPLDNHLCTAPFTEPSQKL